LTSDQEFIPSAIAATLSGSFPSTVNADDANGLFSKLLSKVTIGCAEAGAWMIGHIKANIRSGEGFLSISSTTDDGNVRMRSAFTGPVKDYSMTVNVIVYGIDRQTTAEILVSDVKEMLACENAVVHSQIGCEDPDCGDPMCRDEDHKRVITIR
jgi:hypothetical protein